MRQRSYAAVRSLLLISAVLALLAISSSAQDRFDRCLPDDISKEDSVAREPNVTVAQKLRKLAARCRNGMLVDRRRREIKIVMIECWGNRQFDYQEMLLRQ